LKRHFYTICTVDGNDIVDTSPSLAALSLLEIHETLLSDRATFEFLSLVAGMIDDGDEIEEDFIPFLEAGRTSSSRSAMLQRLARGFLRSVLIFGQVAKCGDETAIRALTYIYGSLLPYLSQSYWTETDYLALAPGSVAVFLHAEHRDSDELEWQNTNEAELSGYLGSLAESIRLLRFERQE
jgi:hypothetical protein